MAIASSRSSRVDRTVPGFTLTEVMVSVMILGLVAAAAFVNLRTSSQRDELNNAARVLAGDLRSLQARALAAQNIKTCTDSVSSKQIVCENSTAACVPATCAPLPPYGVGFHAVKGATTYDLFADVDATKNDWLETDASEVFFLRDFVKSGGVDVVIDDLITTVSQPSIDVSFQRQNGAMGINACYGACVTPVSLIIRLRHTVLNITKDIAINSITGRISIQ